MDSMICKLRAAGLGAVIGNYYFGCLLYADDILLVCHSVTVMQLMLDICSKEAEQLDFTFNAVKSVALRIGPRYRHVCAPLVLSGSSLAYVEQTKYLGAMLKSARSFKCTLDHVKIKFYRCFNAILYRAKNAGSELVCVHLLKTVCMPALLYAVEVLPLTKSDVAMLSHLIDRSVFRIFGCSSPEDVQFIRSALDLPCVSYCLYDRLNRFLCVFRRSFSWAATLIHVVCC